MNLFLERQGTLLLAHRGASAYAPENTLSAFHLAVEQGADGIELDTKLTADGQVVVIHDQTVDRTTNGRGKVNHLTLAQLRELDAGASFHPRFAGEQIPTLAEVFEVIGGCCLIDIEIANYTAPDSRLVDRVVELVRQYGLEDSILCTSFFPWYLARERRRSNLSTELLVLPGMPSWSIGWPVFLPHHRKLDENQVRQKHAAGQKVFTWTVDELDEIRRLLAMGVDGIITNDPLNARRVFLGGGDA